MSAPTRRINRGRGHAYLLDGAPADGVTKIISDGVAKPALVGWAAREGANKVLNDWDALVAMKPAERHKAVLDARYDGLRGATVRGTDVHKLALELAAGDEVDVPEHLEGHIDAYLKFVAEWKPEELITESVVGNRKHRYMGTLDTIARLADGNHWLLDWKTGASGIWPEAALQLAAYRYADFYIDGDGNEREVPPVERTGCVWLRADGYDLIPVAAGLDTFRVFLYAQQLAHFAGDPRETYVLHALTPPETES